MKNKNWIIYLTFFAISFLVLFYLGKLKKNQDDLILKNGIVTMGTVIEKGYVRNRYSGYYFIKFNFQAGDKTYTGYAQLGNNEHYSDKAIVGMRYIVRYLPEEPNKYKNSRIYLDNPVNN